MNTHITPTIGRVVWYKPNPNDATDNSMAIGDQMQSAMVSYVWSDSIVNLSVNDMNGTPYSKTSVNLYQGDPESCPEGYCCWMPYQKQQAAKEAS